MQRLSFSPLDPPQGTLRSAILPFLFLVAASALPLAAEDSPRGDLISWREMLEMERPETELRIAYGEDEMQFAELWLPEGEGPHRVVILIHGGCWLAALPGTELVNFMAEDLRQRGFAVWSLEYRRVGHEGGAYPGTFLDTARATDQLREVAERYRLDLERTVAIGHSAGGHLALWLASRHRIAESSPLYSDSPLPILGAVGLAAIGDLQGFVRSGSGVCGDDTIQKLVDLEQRGEESAYLDTSPAELFPLGVRQILVQGVFDRIVPPFVGLAYKNRARDKGEEVDLRIVEEAGHFEVIAPWSAAWPEVVGAIDELFAARP